MSLHIRLGINHSGHYHNMDLDRLNAEEVQQRLPLMLIVGILAFIGLVSNCHVLYVFVTKMRRSTYRVFVLSLAVIDLLGCTISMPFQIVDESHPYTFAYPVACKLFRFVDTNLAIASALMLVVIAAERYRKICTPRNPQVTELRAIHLSLIMFFVSSVITSPALIVYGQQTIQFEEFNITGSECSWDDYISNSFYGYLYYGLELLCIVICMICITVLYSMVGAAIRKHRKSFGISLAARFDPTHSNSTKIVHRTSDGDEITIDRIFEQGGEDIKRTTLVTFSTLKRGQNDTRNKTENRRSYIAVPETDSLKRAKPEMKQTFEIVNDKVTEQLSVNFNPVSVDINSVIQPEDETLKVSTNTCKQEAIQNRPSSSVSELKIDNRCSTTSTQSSGSPIKRERNLYSIFTHYFRGKSRDVETLREQRITKLLFFITLTFVITYSPYIIILVIYAANRDFSEYLGPSGRVAYLLALRLYLLNNVTNAFFYGFFDLEFRNHCRSIYANLFDKLKLKFFEKKEKTNVCKSVVREHTSSYNPSPPLIGRFQQKP